MEYIDFIIKINDLGNGKYKVFAQSNKGEQQTEFTFPFDEKDLKIFFLTIGRPRKGTRRIDSPEMQAIKEFGQSLYNAVFNGEVRDAFASCKYDSYNSEQGISIKFRLSDTPRISELPWEFLYDGKTFVALSNFSPVMRYLDTPTPIRPILIEPPLNILVVISNPSDVPQLNVQLEFEKLENALRPLINADLLHLKLLNKATLGELQRELRRSTYHVLHYMGHGGFDQRIDEGILLFENDHGRAHEVDGLHLGTILQDHRSLRLIVLNSCEGARASIRDPFSSLAGVLVKNNIPVVVAMQFEITDSAAIKFAEDFYSSVADGFPIESALTEARKGIFALDNDIEWGTPVLFMRGTSGKIFETHPSARSIIAAKDGEQTPVSAPETLINMPKREYPVKSQYKTLATSRTPALIIYMIDISGSMTSLLGGVSRIEVVKNALKSTLIKMIERSRRGSIVVPRYRVALYAYSDGVYDIYDGAKTIDEIANIGIPELTPMNQTDTASAFLAVEKFLKQEIPNIQDHPAPLICHITDGHYTGTNPIPIVQRILDMKVKDGNVLVENILISDDVLAEPIQSINKWRGVKSKSELENEYAKVLFDISSIIPDSIRSLMADYGYDISPNAKMFFPGEYLEFMELGFAMSSVE